MTIIPLMRAFVLQALNKVLARTLLSHCKEFAFLLQGLFFGTTSSLTLFIGSWDRHLIRLRKSAKQQTAFLRALSVAFSVDQ